MKRLPKNPGFVRRFQWLLVALKLNRRQLAKAVNPAATPGNMHALYSKITRWEARELEPPRDELVEVIEAVVEEPVLEETLAWLLQGGATPGWLRGRVPEELGGAIVPDVSAPVMPAQPTTRGNRAEQLLEDTIVRARSASTLEEVQRILDGGLRLVREAKQLGLAAIVSFAMIGAASEASVKPADDPSSRSGGIGRRARFRVGRRVSPPRGEIIKLDDVQRAAAGSRRVAASQRSIGSRDATVGICAKRQLRSNRALGLVRHNSYAHAGARRGA